MNLSQLSLARSWPLLLALVMLAGSLFYFIGDYALRKSVQELEIMNVRQTEQIEELMRRNEALLTDRTMARRRQAVNSQTIEHLRDMLQTSETELRKTRKEYKLFREITDSSQPEALSVHSFQLYVAGGEGHWGYRLIIYQGNFSDVAEGRYDFVLHGHAEGQPAQRRLSDLSKGEREQTFSFRHFETLAGEFQLPEHFEAEQVEIELIPGGEEAETIRKSFGWRQAMGAPG